jgi:hypothetical protein
MEEADKVATTVAFAIWKSWIVYCQQSLNFQEEVIQNFMEQEDS